MMKIAWHWHLHQPPTQKPEVILAINDSCYRPLLALLKDNQQLRVTLSVSRSLIEWWKSLDSVDITSSLKVLVSRGQVELTGTGAYHPILTLIPEVEAIRQIKLEEEVLSESFSANKSPGFFSPEMAVSPKLIDTLSELAYEWVLADEVASIARGHYLEVGGHSTRVLIRDRGASLAVAFGHTQTIASFTNMTKHYGRFQDHLVLVMDGETFGHHWPGALAFLAELVRSPDYEFLTISEVVAGIPVEKVPKISESTWGTSDHDLMAGELYPKWQLRGNEIHKMQWELTDLAIAAVSSEPRTLLDQALHSDQYYWACHNPYWSLEMVGRGAALLVEVSKTSQAQELYNKIMAKGKELYGEEVIVG